MRRWIALLSVALFMLNTGCTYEAKLKRTSYHKYSYEFLGTFDTVTQFMGYAKNEKEFEAFAKKGQARFEELNKLFDIYHDYSGINNIKTINDSAGVKPVQVKQEIVDLIQFSKEWYYKTDGAVNITLGPVLSIWHAYREEGKSNPEKAAIPDLKLLKKAAEKADINKLAVDTENKTVFLQEKGMSLDVGAVAKGFATEIVAKELEKEGYTSFIISSGGNVRTAGKPRDGVRNMWGINIQNPDGNALIPDDEPLDTAFVTDASVVTSGDYQRYYEVNGKRIHHLIDSATLMPANHYRAVTVISENSAVADFMSTTVFLLPYDKSRALVERLDDVEALWIMPDGTINATDNMKKMLKKMGGASGTQASDVYK